MPCLESFEFDYMKKDFALQALKYGVVGVINTLLTAAVIWAMLKFVFGVRNDAEASALDMSVSNICGYAVGLINSFIFNRNWTFKSKGNWKTGFLKFLLAFGVCYLIQLGVVLWINESNVISTIRFEWMSGEYVVTSAYICQLAGIVVYTFLNFICNKYYTFREKRGEIELKDQNLKLNNG